MRDEWTLEELLASWMLLKADRQLVANKRGGTRLGFALLLKFFELEARFPASAREFPACVVEFVARQVQVDPAEFDDYRWDPEARSIKYHCEQTRTAFGFRACTRADQEVLVRWLNTELCPVEQL